MPLNTVIYRNGAILPLNWKSFHVASMVMATALDSGRGPWQKNSFAGLVGKPRPRAIDDWHHNDKCPGMSQNKEDRCLCDGCGKFFPIVIDIATEMQMNYGTISATPLNDGKYTLIHYYQFISIVDGEILELLPGDELLAFRTC